VPRVVIDSISVRIYHPKLRASSTSVASFEGDTRVCPGQVLKSQVGALKKYELPTRGLLLIPSSLKYLFWYFRAYLRGQETFRTLKFYNQI